MNDLTTSSISRQNVLNNPMVVEEASRVLGIQYLEFNGIKYVTKSMAAKFYDVDISTIDRYISDAEDELKSNGYRVLQGIDAGRVANQESLVLGVPQRQGVRQIGIFDLRAFLNLGMLLAESENAKLLRKIILDIVIDFINEKTGGSTRYVNQRDSHFLNAFLQEYDYRREFTNALDFYVDAGKAKYGIMTNRIYRSIFLEKADEYKKVLQLKAKDRIRDTLYSEVLDLISAFEHGFAKVLEKKYNQLGRKLTIWETYQEYEDFEQQDVLEPLINQARSKMASRDLAFRDAFHEKLEEYIRPVSPQEIEHFFGKDSDDVEAITSGYRQQISKLADCDLLFEQLLSDNEDVLKRLKERE